MLGRTVQRLDAANEGGHFPFCLTGGWRQECLVTLVERASPDGVCHSQYRDLKERKRKFVKVILYSRRVQGVRRPIERFLRV